MKTAEFQEYVLAWRRRLQKEEEKKIALFYEARSAAETIASLLVKEFGAKRVYLYGSLLNIEDFTIYSDIDLF